MPMQRLLTRLAEGAAEARVGAEGAEAVVVELKGIDTDSAQAPVQLEANVPITTPAEATEQTVRIRRETLTGRTVATEVIKLGASNKGVASINANDIPGLVANMTYVVTLQEASRRISFAVNPTLSVIY